MGPLHSPSALSFVVGVLSALTLAACVYYVIVVAAGMRFRIANRRPTAHSKEPRPVSILKAVSGYDPQLSANLRSHARLDYRDFELVFGVADADDPAVAKIERLRKKYPELPIQLHVCGPPGPGNAKVAILEKLAAHATHNILLVNDADIRLGPRDLTRLVAELTPSVGLVTTLYRAAPGSTTASRLDSVWISGDFPGQALTGAYLAGLSFALGATMLFRKSDLAKIGGFASIREYLADDYELGRRIAALGRPVRLSRVVVETVLGAPTWRDVWLRHLRWSRTIRASRPGGHLGFGVTFGVLWGLLLLAVGGPAWPLACAVTGRTVASAMNASTVRAGVLFAALLAPFVELWSAVVWLWSFAGNEVVWRGRRLHLDRAGRIVESRI